MFLILDFANVDRDMALARHVTFIHQNEGTDAKNGGGGGVDTVPMDKDKEDEFGLDKDRGEGNDQPMTLITSGLLQEYITWPGSISP